VPLLTSGNNRSEPGKGSLLANNYDTESTFAQGPSESPNPSFTDRIVQPRS